MGLDCDILGLIVGEIDMVKLIAILVIVALIVSAAYAFLGGSTKQDATSCFDRLYRDCCNDGGNTMDCFDSAALSCSGL